MSIWLWLLCGVIGVLQVWAGVGLVLLGSGADRYPKAPDFVYKNDPD